MRRLGLGLSLFIVALAGACSGAPDTTLLDDSSSGGDDGGRGNDGTAGNCDVSKCPAVPPGFTAVRLEQGQTSCPSGWSSTNEVTSPAVSDGACTCGCNITNPPNCNVGNVVRFLDDTTTPSCGLAATTLAANQGGCTPFSALLTLSHAHYAVDPPAAVGGTCSFTAKLETSKLTSTAVRVCAPPASCMGAVCDGPMCVVQDGDVTCPQSFPNKTLVGSEATATCSACGATPCAVQGKCTGKLAFFTDGQCTMGEVDFAANATCSAKPTSAIGPYLAYSYEGSVASANCAGTPPTSTATPSLENPRTVCCQ